MKRIKLLIKSPIAILILLIALFIPAFIDTISVGYYPMHDDLQPMRQLVMDKCFRDGQIPCRWSEDLGFGFGYPLFNFYPPLPYYIGQVIHWIGFSFIDTVKVLVVLNFLTSGFLMYLLAKEFWGKWGGLISAVFYVYAPYHAVDIYVRAAMNEAWALAFFPLVFWSIYKLIITNKWIFVPVVSISVALVMLSHNPILLIFSTFAIFWTFFWLIIEKGWRVLPKLLVSGIWALGLAAFFTLPVIFEQKYVHVESLVIGYFNFLAHFTTLDQLFISRFWGYGASLFGPVDDLSFQVGHIHWIISLVSLLVALAILRKKQTLSILIVLMFSLTAFYTFMSHQQASFIWERISILQYLQFPWRFLTLTIFGTSFLAGSIMLLSPAIGGSNKLKLFKWIPAFAGTILILVTIFFYKDYFKWEKHWNWVDDTHKFSGELWKLQITAGIFDYLPKGAKLPPPNPPDGDAKLVSGSGQVNKVFKNSIKQEYSVRMEEKGVFQINTFYFPGWIYKIDGKQVEPVLEKELGLPQFNLDSGEYKVTANLTNTPVRNAGNLLSLVSWMILLSISGYNFKKKLIIFKYEKD